jgi:hypothetical protein
MKVEDIPRDVLFAVRQRMGAEHENDSSKDAIIE